MAKKGLPSITLGAVTYDDDDCLQSASFTDGVEDLTYRCGGYMKHEAGDRTITHQFSIVTESTDTTKWAAFAPGATYTTCAYHPYGDSTGRVEHTSTLATVLNRNVSGSPGSIVTLDVTVAWDNITSGAAS